MSIIKKYGTQGPDLILAELRITLGQMADPDAGKDYRKVQEARALRLIATISDMLNIAIVSESSHGK